MIAVISHNKRYMNDKSCKLIGSRPTDFIQSFSCVMAQWGNNSMNFTSANTPHLPRTSYLLFYSCLVQLLLLLICAAHHVLRHKQEQLQYGHKMRCYQSGNWGTWWHICFRHCTTSRKVAGSIPDGVIGIFH